MKTRCEKNCGAVDFVFLECCNNCQIQTSFKREMMKNNKRSCGKNPRDFTK